MDILSIASQLFGAVQQNPNTIQSLVEHPYSTTQQVTGASQKLDRADIAQVLTALAALMGGAKPQTTQQPQGLNLGAIASAASSLLGQNNNSVHSLASSLFSVPQQQPAQAQPNALSSLVNVASLAGALLGTGNTGPKVDLSDGFDLNDIAGIASMFMKQ